MRLRDLFVSALLLVVCSCSYKAENTVPVTVIEKAVSMQLPVEWTPRKLLYTSCDAIGEASFGKGEDSKLGIAGVFIDGFFVEMRRRPHQLISAIQRQEVGISMAKHQGSRLLSFSVNEQENSLTIDFAGDFAPNYPIFFYRSKLIIKGDEWVRINFRGVDTPIFRKTVNEVTESINVKLIPLDKRRVPCKEIKI